MKIKRFALLAKIVLLTGLLTIFTVTSSLSINLLISYTNTKKSYTESCENLTDNIESVFATDDETLLDIVNFTVDLYEKFEEEHDYDTATQDEIDAYQKNTMETIFGPIDGKFGMNYEKLARKSYYSESIARVQFLCSSFKVPYALMFLYNSKTNQTIYIINSDISIDENLVTIGRRGPTPSEAEIESLNKGSETQTLISNDIVYSFNQLEITTINPDYKCFVQGQYPFAEFNKAFNEQLLTQILITIGSAIFLVIVYALLTKFFLLKNVERLEESTSTFVDMMKNDKKLSVVDSNVRSNDEIKDLSDKFMLMQDQIIHYVENIKKAKSVEEAFKAEVSIASKIQLESLPSCVFFEKNIELRAFIKPAKGVGGDFYDYFFIDDNHLAFVIADVSGKGIPASLFMMRSKESIRSAVMNEKDLSKAFYKVNNALCINNKEGYFVTVFLGVLNTKTYEFEYVSSGHERPFIKRGKDAKRIDVDSNFVLGLEEDFSFNKQKLQLKEGDSIVLYTDGLNEAIDSNKEEFGYERIAKSLQKSDILSQNIDNLINDVEEFKGKEEQFDDITVLSFKINKNTVTYSYLNPTYNDIDDLTGKVEEYLDNLDVKTLSKIGVVIDEVMNNIISYGKTKANKTLSVSIEKLDKGAILVFVDNSHPFNPLLKEKRTVQENLEKGIEGGLGISIVKSISNETEYAYENNKNILIIKF